MKLLLGFLVTLHISAAPIAAVAQETPPARQEAGLASSAFTVGQVYSEAELAETFRNFHPPGAEKNLDLRGDERADFLLEMSDRAYLPDIHTAGMRFDVIFAQRNPCEDPEQDRQCVPGESSAREVLIFEPALNDTEFRFISSGVAGLTNTSTINSDIWLSGIGVDREYDGTFWFSMSHTGTSVGMTSTVYYSYMPEFASEGFVVLKVESETISREGKRTQVLNFMDGRALDLLVGHDGVLQYTKSARFEPHVLDVESLTRYELEEIVEGLDVPENYKEYFFVR